MTQRLWRGVAGLVPNVAEGAPAVLILRKRRGDPDFLYVALDTTAYAAFFNESRMNCAGATELHRKSGGSPISANLFGRQSKSEKMLVFGSPTRHKIVILSEAPRRFIA
jgi:hypothetical protein